MVDEVGSSSPLDTDFVTVAVWIYRTEKSTTLSETLVAKDGVWKLSLVNGVVTSQFFLVDVDDDDVHGDPIWTSTPTWSQQNIEIPIATWTHVAISYGSDGMERHYVNGTQIDYRLRTTDPL